jgi:hypothetical protein
MPEYTVGGQTIRRKNLYMPCIIGPRFEKMTEVEQVQVLKATWWADLIAGSEWPALLKHDDFNPSARSRLKKKGAGWLIALGRIAAINPELFAEIRQRAAKEYEEQTETEHPFLEVLDVCFSTRAKWKANNEKPDHSRTTGWVVEFGYLDDYAGMED